ncbi:MAG: hypothetical protein LBI42_05325 [Chitinispirillales bacterium]|jgi:trehalose/maltose hydrolase-like predicted phosphorylase|nr:hypothetical protein [Chitinispirillales bacterium]
MENGNFFHLTYKGYMAASETHREALCTLGNGYFATRGAHESSHADGFHYPGTYLAGGYNRLKSTVAGHVVENEDLVNWPNWLVLKLRVGDGQWFSLDHSELLFYEQTLDMRHGVLHTKIRFKDESGRVSRLESERLVHIKNPHIAAIRWKLTAENWSGPAAVENAIDATVTNSGVKRYRDLSSTHLEVLRCGAFSDDGIFLEAQSCQSHLRMAVAARCRVFNDIGDMALERTSINKEKYIAQQLSFELREETTATVEKYISIYTSRDTAISEPAFEACNEVKRLWTFEKLFISQRKAWKHLWNRFDIHVESDFESQLLIHLHIFHILQTASPSTYVLDVGIPPRGLHGEAYRGHIFWDELFVFPLLNLRNPLLTREFLLYRYHRLEEARHAAKKAGFKGAMFPWQSGSDGREENQKIHLNPQSGRWLPDVTHLQHHVNSAVAFNVWHYYQVTDDKEFLYYFGAEIILEIARFWSSKAHFNPKRERFEIHGVMGPDEYHTAYPGASNPGINNNAYTNFMAAWVIDKALKTLRILDKRRREELLADLEIDNKELDRWNIVCARMFIPINCGVIEQYEGFCELKELDWAHYRKRYGDNFRLDRILESENDSVNNYQAGKQADALMLFYLFSIEELSEMFVKMGYDFAPQTILSTIDYYKTRTAHGSSLSRIVFSWVISRSDRNGSWDIFKNALEADFKDALGGTTSEGIHLGAMAGTVDLIQRCYTGLEIRENVLYFKPRLPKTVSEIRMSIRFRSHWIAVTMNHKTLTLSFERGWGNPIRVNVEGEEFIFSEEETRFFRL